MALINCPECGKEISDKAKRCPYCGYPRQRYKNKITLKNFKDRKIVISFFLLVILCFIILIIKNIPRHSITQNTIKSSSTHVPLDNKKENSLILPDNLNKKQKDIMRALQGTWSSRYYNTNAKFIFNGMKVQYYNQDPLGVIYYEKDLQFINVDDKTFLAEINDSYDSEGKAYSFENNAIVIYYLKGKLNNIQNLVNWNLTNANYECWVCGKISKVNTFITKPKIGMTKEEVENSLWGSPNDINKTTTAYKQSEQWVYDDDKYVYFDDGIVTSIQE